jgi:hypothetical protein
MEELKKLSNKRVKRMSLLFFTFTIILFGYFTGDSIVKLMEGPKDINSIPIKDFPNTYVNAEVHSLYNNGAGIITGGYNIIPVGKNKFIMLEVTRRNNRITSPKITGTISKMDARAYQFYINCFKNSGNFENHTTAEIEKMVLPYVLHKDFIGKKTIYFIYLSIGFAIFFLLLSFIMVIKSVTGLYLSEIRNLTEKEGIISELQLEADYRNAVHIEAVSVGRKYTYYLQLCKVKLISNSDIVWVYTKNESHIIHGIPQTSHYIIVYTKDKKKHKIMMSPEVIVNRSNSANTALSAISQAQPNAVIGYSKKLENLFKKDYNSFLKHTTL